MRQMILLLHELHRFFYRLSHVSDRQGSGCSSCTLRGTTHYQYDGHGNIVSTTGALEGNAKQLPDRLGLGEGRIDLYRALMSVIQP